MDNIILVTMLTIAIAAAVAAWPLAMLPRFRPAIQGSLGSLLLATGCGTFVLFCGGLSGTSFWDRGAMAADSGASEAVKEVKPAAPTAPASLATPDEASFFVPPGTLPADTQLNTPPQATSTEVLIPPGRPDWVETASVRVGSVHSTAVNSGPFSLPIEAERELDQLLKAKTDEYIAEHLGSSLAPSFVGYDIVRIKRELIKPTNTYREQITVSVGPMHQSHALLEFSPEFRREIEHRWNQVKGTARLGQTGFVALGALLLLGTVFGYFRLDTATRGYYTGRLQFLAAAAILSVVGAGVVLARWVPWL